MLATGNWPQMDGISAILVLVLSVALLALVTNLINRKGRHD